MIRRVLVTTAAAAVMLSGGLVAQNTLSPDVLLRRAMQLEQVDGDLAGAVRQYQDIVDRFPERRPIAAQALVRIGGIHERFGRTAEALAAYKRVETDYPDTEPAAAARERIAGLDDSQARETVIWSGPDVGDVYSISPDGRLLAYLAMQQGNLSVAIRDLATGTNRIIAPSSDEAWAEEVVFSHDGRQVAYSWAKEEAPYYEVRIVSVTGGEPRVVSTMAEGFLTLYDWSKDGRWIAVEMNPPGTTVQHVVINVADGSQKVLKTVPRHASTEGMAFSPDGRYLAYDRPADDNRTDTDVFLLPVAGGAEILAATGPEDQAVAGWSPDGRYLLVQEGDFDGRNLVAQPISNGAPSGPSLTLRRGLKGWGSSMTAAGGLLLTVNENPTTVYGAAFDARTGALTEAPSRLVAGESNRLPRFSQDGRQLAFISNPRTLSVQRLDTRQRTILPLLLRNLGSFDWAPDGRSFLALATDLQDRSGVYQIDAATGNATALLVNTEDVRHFTPHWAADGRHFYVTRGRPRENRGDGVIELDPQTGTELVLLDWSQVRATDGSPVPPLRDHRVSPDGRHVAGLTREPQVNHGAAIWIASVADRRARQLLTVPARQSGLPLLSPNTLTWTADGGAVLINRAGEKSGDNRGLWIVPIDGSSPRMLAIDLPLSARDPAALHPDGRRIAFVVGTERTREIRLLEDFLPAPAGRR